jgi:signal transduction histidine kinase
LTNEQRLRLPLTAIAFQARPDAEPIGVAPGVAARAPRYGRAYALTNVLKHAGPGARSEVRVSLDTDAVSIEVTDDGHAVTTLPGSGHGIVGMRERALLLGEASRRVPGRAEAFESWRACRSAGERREHPCRGGR